MSVDLQFDTIYNSSNKTDKMLLSQMNKPETCICLPSCSCFNESWCFAHTGITSNREYNENVNNCCTYLDCCTWCLEFRTNKYSICKNQTIFYLCCFSIYFT